MFIRYRRATMDIDKKNIRKQQILFDKNKKHKSLSDEEKFVSKKNKHFKKNKEDLRADELWEDWEQNEND